MGAIWSRPADMPALTAPVIIYTNILFTHVEIINMLVVYYYYYY